MNLFMKETRINSKLIEHLVEHYKAIPNASMSNYTSFQVGGLTPALIKCESRDQILKIIKYLNLNKQSFIVIGQGTNLLVSDSGTDDFIIRFCNHNEPKLKISKGIVTVGGEVLLDEMVKNLNEQGYGDLSYLSGIPGTLGGAVKGNAGAFGEQIGDCLLRAELISYDGNQRWVEKDELKFSYRSSALRNSREILLQAELVVKKVDSRNLNKRRDEILKLRKSKHPDWINEPCAGSIFRNIEPSSAAEKRQAAGWFLEQSGAHNLSEGKAVIYNKHANIIIANPGSSATDIFGLSLKMKKVVKQKFNLDLVREVQLIGNFMDY